MSPSRPIPGPVLGVDLAGSPRRPTGLCLLRGDRAETRVAFTDEEILEAARAARPALVAIDAPLNLPPGRRSIHERNGSHYRPCDLALRERRIPFFPITLGPMRSLTERGLRLKAALERHGLRVVEIYPGAAQDLWRIPRARRDMAGLLRGLRRLGIRGLTARACEHELDAASGALVGRLFLEGDAEVLGDFDSGAILVPKAAPGRARAEARSAAARRPRPKGERR